MKLVTWMKSWQLHSQRPVLTYTTVGILRGHLNQKIRAHVGFWPSVMSVNDFSIKNGISWMPNNLPRHNNSKWHTFGVVPIPECMSHGWYKTSCDLTIAQNVNICLTSKLHNLMLCLSSTSMTLAYHIWFRSMDLLRPMKQAMLNMSTSLQGDESPKSVRLCICSARRSIGGILASFLYAQTGLHLQQLGLHTWQQTLYMCNNPKLWWQFVQTTLFTPFVHTVGLPQQSATLYLAVCWFHFTSLPAVLCLTYSSKSQANQSKEEMTLIGNSTEKSLRCPKVLPRLPLALQPCCTELR